MTLKFNLITVPHSGTRFLMRFFLWCGLDTAPRHRNSNEDLDYNFDHFNEKQGSDMPDKRTLGMPVACTVRHPYDVAISWKTRDKDIGQMIDSYRQFIVFSTAHKPFLFDITCPQDNREQHLIELLNHCDVYTAERATRAAEYATFWKPVGSLDSEYKTRYINDGTLPNYNWSRLQGLVKWYEDFKAGLYGT